jgi:hypothetical protein
MKRLLAVALVVCGVAWAGNAAKDVAVGAAPVSSLDGVTLGNAVGCRCSIRVDAGTAAATIGSRGFAPSGWSLYAWYYDSTLGWVEGNSDLRCAAEARLDAGNIRAFVCPDIVPAARFGRLACASFGPTGHDGGTGADMYTDAGAGPQPRVRTECWGPNLVQ